MVSYILVQDTVKRQLSFFIITNYLKQQKQTQGNDNGRILPKTKEKEEKA